MLFIFFDNIQTCCVCFFLSLRLFDWKVTICFCFPLTKNILCKIFGKPRYFHKVFHIYFCQYLLEQANRFSIWKTYLRHTRFFTLILLLIHLFLHLHFCCLYNGILTQTFSSNSVTFSILLVLMAIYCSHRILI